MTRAGARVADAAAAMIGTRFRLHGRHPRHGLDCVGLVVCALAASGHPIKLPMGYRLRNNSIESQLAAVAAGDMVEVSGCLLPGDVVMAIPGPAQHHLLIAETPNSFVHADAAIGRVVRTFSPLPWPITRRWRIKPDI